MSREGGEAAAPWVGTCEDRVEMIEYALGLARGGTSAFQVGLRAHLAEPTRFEMDREERLERMDAIIAVLSRLRDLERHELDRTPTEESQP